MKSFRKIVAWILVLICIMGNTRYAVAKTELSESQKETADYIAEVTAAEYDTYRILPSVAVCQAFQESSLGVYNIDKNNLWGIKKGGGEEGNRSYDSLYDGIIDYLEVLQDETYYKNVRGVRSHSQQLWNILLGGYYGGSKKSYFSVCLEHYANHNFAKYDEKMWSTRREEKLAKRKLEKQKKEFLVHHDPTIGSNEIKISSGVVEKGSVGIVSNHMILGRYDVINGTKGYNVYVNDPELDGMKVLLDVKEGAVG